MAESGEKAGARALIYLRRKDGVGAGDFRRLINKELVPALAGTGMLRELRTQTFLPWNEKLWDTPNVAHDNPADQRFHASLILGFTDAQERAGFFHGREIESLSNTLAPLTSAIHAYDVSAALTYVKDGAILPHWPAGPPAHRMRRRLRRSLTRASAGNRRPQPTHRRTTWTRHEVARSPQDTLPSRATPGCLSLVSTEARMRCSIPRSPSS